MTAWPLDGREELARRLEGSFGGGRVHHAFLLSGPEGAGKRTLALALARGFLCPSGPLFLGCGACGSCRRAAGRSHPDLLEVAKEAERTAIPVSAVRAAIDWLGRAPVSGRARVLLVLGAETLHVEGQNALLKTLEEPFEGCRLILTTTRPEALLPTVLSRVQRIGLPPLDDAAMAAFLERAAPDLAPERRARILALAGGSPGRARRILDEGWDELLAPFLEGGRAGPEARARLLSPPGRGKLSREERRARAAFVLDLLLAAERRRLGREPAAEAACHRLLEARRRLDLGLAAEIVLAPCLGP